jgi:HD-GYP domain-containing protein (c-di-GMP phosphodiesterase class II)/DNA-binding CsgD family transcriptional regulator
MSEESRPLRLAEATGAMSLATDLAMGQPLEHGLRTAILAVRIARTMGLGEDEQAAAYYTGMLHFAGCTAESDVDSGFFGDELAARPQMMAAYLGSRRELIATAMRVARPGSPPLSRAASMAVSAFGGMAEFRKWAASHCDVARVLGARMGFSEQILLALRHLYERWDGKGMPGELREAAIPLPVRLMQVAQDAEVAWQHGSTGLAHQIVARRAGSGLDPKAVEACLSLGDRLFDGMDAPYIWDYAMQAEPGPQPVVSEERLDACLSAMADFADLKSTWTIGHSRGVADLVGRAADAAGVDPAAARLLRQSALVHDIGRVAVPVSVWAKPGQLTRAEREQVRLHAYHSERVLDAVPGLRPLARLAGAHGERSDGSGYHRGSKIGDLPLTAWLLAAADCYQAMRERRAYRSALSASVAADELYRDAAAVLGLLARGLSTKQVASRLGISPKTCDHHIQSLYAKVGVSTRAGATLFALEHGLVSTD